MRAKHLWAGLALVGSMGMMASAHAVTELNASIWFPESQPLAKVGYLEWAKSVAKASNGDLKINVFTGTSLLPVAAHLSGLRDGIADITYHAGTYTPSDLPEDNVLAMLGIALKDDPMLVAFAVADFYINDPAMQALWKRQKIVFMGAYSSVAYNLICRTKVETLADLKGLKLRTPGPIHADWARSVGATPINVPSSEMFTGLDKGQIDCAVMGANELKTRSLWDVAKFTNTANLGPYFAGWEWAMHAPTWKKLTDKQRATLLSTIADATVDTEIAYIESGEQALAEAPSHKATVTAPSADLTKSIRDFAAHARSTAIKEGTERFKLKDPEALVARFESTIAKWDRLMQGIDRKDAKALKALLHANLYDKIDVKSYGK